MAQQVFGKRFIWARIRETQRSLCIGIRYPRAFCVMLLTMAGKLMGIKCVKRVEREADSLKIARRNAEESIGWAMGSRVYDFRLKNRTIVSVRVTSELENNLINFFLNRSPMFILRDFKSFMEMDRALDFPRGIRIFEPGCNAGKMLFFLKDLLGAEITGADIYEPAIQLAEKIKSPKDSFICTDLISSNWLDSQPEGMYHLTISSSHLVHMTHFDDFDRYMLQLCRTSRYLYINDRWTQELSDGIERLPYRKLNVSRPGEISVLIIMSL